MVMKGDCPFLKTSSETEGARIKMNITLGNHGDHHLVSSQRKLKSRTIPGVSLPTRGSQLNEKISLLCPLSSSHPRKVSLGKGRGGRSIRIRLTHLLEKEEVLVSRPPYCVQKELESHV